MGCSERQKELRRRRKRREKIDLFRKTELDQIVESLVARLLHARADDVIARLQANDRAVEVQIGGVNEFEGLQGG